MCWLLAIMLWQSTAGTNYEVSLHVGRYFLVFFFFSLRLYMRKPGEKRQLEAAQLSSTKGLGGLQLAAGLGWKHGNYSALLVVGGGFRTQIMWCLSQDLAEACGGPGPDELGGSH